MTTLDLPFVRAQFPAFSEPSLQEFAHFENAGGSYACGQAIDALERFYRCNKVQPYHHFAPSSEGGEQMDRAYERMAAWLNVFLLLGELRADSRLARRGLRPGDVILGANDVRVRDLGEFEEAIGAARGTLYLEVLRRGREYVVRLD